MAESMKQAAVMLGATPNQSMGSMFDDLLEKVRVMKDQLEVQED